MVQRQGTGRGEQDGDNDQREQHSHKGKAPARGGPVVQMHDHEPSLAQPEPRSNLGVIALHGIIYAFPLFLAGIEGGYLGIALGLGLLLIWVSVHDLQTMEIPDIASILLVVTGLGVIWATGGALGLRIAGAVVWSTFFAAVAVGYRRFRGFDGLGLGDAKLMAGAGAWLGVAGPITVVLGASVSGIIYLLVQRSLGGVSHRDLAQSPIAFGPYLCFFIWVVWLFGPIEG